MKKKYISLGFNLVNNMIAPIFKQFSLESMREVIENCKSFPRYSALVICANFQETAILFTNIPTKEFLGGNIKIDRNKRIINILYNNMSWISFQISSDNTIGRRVNALLYSENIKQSTLNSVYYPMQTPYISKK